MRRGNWLALGTLLGGLSLGLLFTAPAHSQKAPKKEETLIQRLARKAKLSEDNAQRFMGPARPRAQRRPEERQDRDYNRTWHLPRCPHC